MKFLWKIGGEAGFGIMTTGLIFSKIASRVGYHIFDYQEYPSLIRGGHNTYEVVVSEEEVFASKKKIDLLICLNKETYKKNRQRLFANSIVIFDGQDFKIDDNNFLKINLPFKKILEEEKAPLIMMNNIALGASLALMNWDFLFLEEIIKETFAKKGQEVINQNKNVAKRGYQWIKENYYKNIFQLFPQKKSEKKLVLTGNDAFSLGTVVADCRFYAAYPMTPSSSVLHNLAEWAEETGMVVRHAEDEISVINTAIGSSFVGVRSAVGTSGGGFALMVESVALAGMTETPLVIFLAQRPAPATGMPTWTEQGDLLFAIHSGHGEFPKIVLAPGDVEEMYQLTAKAFDLADFYQTPVIVLSDKFLSESHKSTSYNNFLKFAKYYHPKRGKLITKEEIENKKMKIDKYLRYQVTADGISPRLTPGTPGYFYQGNSYEHLEDGHTTEEAEERKKQVDKRNKKIKTYLMNHFQPPKIIGNLEKARLVFVSWGSNKGPIIEAMKELRRKQIETAYFHFTHVYPLDEKKIKPLFNQHKKFILIENNSWGQFGRLLRQEGGIEIKDKLLKYDGRPFWPEEIIECINTLTN